MSEAEPKFTDPVDTSGKSRIWLPILAAMFLFLIAAAAIMLISSLVTDAGTPQAPGTPGSPDSPVTEQIDAGN